MRKIRLAIIVSHPIQYYVPLYRWLARSDTVEIKVFFTWHGGETAQLDRGFGQQMAWDIPLREGYTAEVVPNVSLAPGAHHFLGIVNPGLVHKVLSWQPDAVHLTGYAFASHLHAMHAFHRRRVPLLFRGDSHLLDAASGWRRTLKRVLLPMIYRWPAVFLYVGQANRAYYEEFGVPKAKLSYCTHSVEVARFAEPDAALEEQARTWRRELNIPGDATVLLFAGKFEDKKRPIQLMQWLLAQPAEKLLLVLIGGGPLEAEVKRLAAQKPELFRVLPVQNQTRMPVAYRLGDIFVLPSAYQETWGLAVNEALACGRPVLVSDAVGSAADVVKPGDNGEIFRSGDWSHFGERLAALRNRRFDPAELRAGAAAFDIPATGTQMLDALRQHLFAA